MISVKKECIDNNSMFSPYGMLPQFVCPTNPIEIQRERRFIRAEIIRCKRAGVPCDDTLLVKKRRLDEVTTAVVQRVSPTAEVEDANRIRQLRNRESAERSRLKKDLLVESLTYQVLQCVLQITDLKEEQSWLRNQQLYGTAASSGASSPISASTLCCDDNSSVSSAFTTCDEAESDSEFDNNSNKGNRSRSDSTGGYSSITCSSPVHSSTTNNYAVDFCTKLNLVTPPLSPTTSTTYCYSSNSGYHSSSSSCSSYYSEDDLLNDCADLIDTWMLEGL